MRTVKLINLGSNKCLNVQGNTDSLYDNQNVTIWQDSGSSEQRWKIYYPGLGEYIRSYVDPNFALNINTSVNPHNCDLYSVSKDDTGDMVLHFEEVYGYTDPKDSFSTVYQIYAANYDNLYLTAASASNGANVYWANNTDSPYQYWKCEYADEDIVGTPLLSYDDLFANLSYVDLVARCIYSEARGETNEGKRAVAAIIRNRKNKYRNEFGGNTYSGVVLKAGQFSGMNTASALEPNTNSDAWEECLDIAKNIDTISNPIGNCLWYRTNSTYNANMKIEGGVEKIFLAGIYHPVVEKYVIGNHTFYRINGY